MGASVLLRLLAAGLYGASDFCGGLAARRSNVLAVLVYSQASGFVLVAAAAALLPSRPTSRDVLLGASAGIAAVGSSGLLYRALGAGRMGIVAPMSGAAAMVGSVAAAIGLGEHPSSPQLLGVGGCLCAIALLRQKAVHPTTEPIGRAVPILAVSSGGFIALFLVALSLAAPDAGVVPLLVARAVTLSAVLTFGGASRVLEAERRSAALAVWCGGLDIAANATFLYAAHASLLSLTAALSSLYPAATIILARVFLGERFDRASRIGLTLALAGSVLIAR